MEIFTMSTISTTQILRVLRKAFLMAILAFAGNAFADDALPIRIAYPAGMNGEIPVVLDKAGIAKNNGLDAEYTFFQNGPPMMEALASGNIDVVVSSFQPFATFISRQPDKAVIVAQLGHSSYSLLVPKDSPIKSLADLKGKRIALSFGSDSHLDLLRSIRKVNLDPATNFQLLNLPPNELLLALNQGFAEAVVVRQPQVQRLQEQFGVRIVQTWPHHYLVAVRSEYLAKYPVARERLLASLRQSVAYIVNNGDQAAIWFGERLRISPEVVKELAKQNPVFRGVKRPEDVHIEFGRTHLQLFNEWLVASFDNGLLKTKVEPFRE
jgi:ABC-type nitrate/sulfonate/bicarbonate transport system substrate-binding protein